MTKEKSKNLEIRSYEISIILSLNISPVHLLNPATAIIEGQITKFRSLYRFLEKQRKIRKNDEFDRIISILKAMETNNGVLLNLSTTNTYDAIYIRIAFDGINELNDFDNALKTLY